MTLIRDREIFLPRRTEKALRLAAEVLADDNTNADGLAVRYLDECLERDYPGVFEVLDQCQYAFDLAKITNKALVDEWAKMKRLQSEILPPRANDRAPKKVRRA